PRSRRGASWWRATAASSPARSRSRTRRRRPSASSRSTATALPAPASAAGNHPPAPFTSPARIDWKKRSPPWSDSGRQQSGAAPIFVVTGAGRHDDCRWFFLVDQLDAQLDGGAGDDADLLGPAFPLEVLERDLVQARRQVEIALRPVELADAVVPAAVHEQRGVLRFHVEVQSAHHLSLEHDGVR